MRTFRIARHAPSLERVVIHLRLSATGVLHRAGAEPAPLAPRDALMLAWLAVEGPTRRARLAALLWPDASDDGARTALRQRVFQLRRRFGTDLLTDGHVIALAPGVSHDLDTAQSMLDGVEFDAGSEVLDWLSAQRRARLDAACRSLGEAADVAEQASDWPAALGNARQLLALAPHAEEAHRRVIRLHYLAGDRAAALVAFDRCEAVLKHEVGATPSSETLALLRLVTESDHAATGPAVAPRTALLRPPRLVGRDAARATLARAIDERRLALAIAEAGMGKSRVLADAVERCRAEGHSVLSVRARPGDALLPNAVAARWLEELLAMPGTEPTPEVRAELARLLPALGTPASAPDPRGDRLRRALSTLLQGAAKRGLQAVVVDDLHHADDASLGLLLPLAEEGACGWLLAMRGGELAAATRRWVDLQLQASALPVELPTLTAAEVNELIESLGLPAYADASVAESLLRHTGGNPMFVLETLRASLSDSAPGRRERRPWPRVPGVRQLIDGRLARLSPLALNLVRCAAVAGPDLSADLAAAVLGLRSLDLADAWTELEAADVLRGTDFAHDLIGEAARDALPEPIARSLHADVARWMEQRGGAPARIASHWIAAGDAARSVPHLLNAARQAQAAWQLETAAALWQQAAEILRAAGDRRGAFDALFHAAHTLSERVIDERLEAHAQALEELAGDDPGLRAAAALARLAVHVEARRLDDALRLATEALAMARRACRSDVEVELLWDLTVIHWESGRQAEAAEAARGALDRLEHIDAEGATLLALEGTRLKLLHALGTILSASCRFAEGNDFIEQARTLARLEGNVGSAVIDGVTLAENAIALGDLAAALRHSEEAMADARASAAGPDSLGRALRARAGALAIAGDPGGALALLEEAVHAGERAVRRYDADFRRALHWLQYELGRHDLAAKGLRQLHMQEDLLPATRLLVEATLLRLGDSVDASALLDRASNVASATLRAQVLSLAAPGCDPERVLPLLSMTAAAARDNGAYGLWLGLQAHAIAAMRALGRLTEARVAAEVVWRRIDEGACATELFPRVARELYLVWRGEDDDRAQLVSLRASAWMRKAAMGLPPEWRENFLNRAPARLGTTFLPP
jgi:DNA-binding SARP family transcriptional activator/tetratricopeptide (TPR) repeat protein